MARKLGTPMESVRALLRAIQNDIDSENQKVDGAGNKVDPDPDVIETLRARQLQAERLRSHIELQDKKLEVSFLASPKWQSDSAKIVKELATCTCGARERVLKLLSELD